MTDACYPLWLQSLLAGDANSALSGTVKLILVDSANYTYSPFHQFLSDVPALARTAVSGAFTTKTFTGGVFDADDVVMPAVTGPQSEYLILFIDTGVEGTSRLICFIDQFLAGMPITPNGNNITVSWDNGAFKIFKFG